MLYILNCNIQKSYYQSSTKNVEVNHIVEADNEQSAMDKVAEYYKKKDEEFFVIHWVSVNYCNEILK